MITKSAFGLGAMKAVGLDELNERAALLTRVDRKYVVRAVEIEGFVDALQDTARVLEVDGRRQFAYRSTYLDTPERESFHSAGRSRRRRWKVRTRTYLDSGSSWLEVKTRLARDQTSKQRIAHPDAHACDGLTAVGRSFVADIVGVVASSRITPALDTFYRRTTLFLPASSSRTTIDTDLRWTSMVGGAELERPELAIVETKTGSTPSAVDRLLWSRGHRPVRISKFGVGLAALEHGLPRLKWHHAMDKHLRLTPTDR